MPDASRPRPLLRLGTRRSPLAMAQAHEARARLCAAHGWDEAAVELVPVVASGDRIQDRPLAEIGGKALWTRELDACLADGSIDAAVHSMKDVETIRPDSIAIGAILPRADKADVLLGAGSIVAIPQGARVGTSAPRRSAQLLHARPDCTVVHMRGNVGTRIAKVAAGEADITFLAAAGLARLGEDGVGTRLDPSVWLPAPAQAAIGIECRSEDQQALQWLAPIDHADSRAEVLTERSLLEALGGNCQSPVAMFSKWDGEAIILQVAIFSPDGAEKITAGARFPSTDRTALRDLAEQILADAPESVRAHFRGIV